MRQVKNFRIFNKIQRKYYKRHCIKRVDHFNGRRFVSYWEKDDWLGYRIDDSKQLTPEVCEAIRLMIGDDIYNKIDFTEFLNARPNFKVDDDKLFDSDVIIFEFRGFMITNRDAYAILGDANEYLYPIYKLLKYENNLYPSC